MTRINANAGETKRKVAKTRRSEPSAEPQSGEPL